MNITENIFAFFLSKFFINILDSAYCLMIAIILYNPKYKIKRLISGSILMGFFFAVGFIIAQYSYSNLNVFLGLMTGFVFGPLIVKQTLNLNLIKAFAAYVLMQVFQAFPAFTLPYILDALNLSTNELINDPVLLFILNFIVLIMSLIFLPPLKWMKKFAHVQKDVPRKHIILIIVLIISNVLVSLMHYAFLDSYIARYNLERDIVNYFVTVILIIVNFVISVFISLKLSNLGVKEKELENQVFYNNILLNITNDLRRIKHNHNNIISSIAGLAESENWSGLKEYLNELISLENKMYSTNLISLTNIKNGAILGILNSKIEKARQYDVSLTINVEGEVNEINMPISQFCEVLGILLDNAIEAAADSFEKYAKVTITSENKKILFRLENSCKGKPDVVKMFQKDWSTKGEGRGLGLWIVNNIKRKHKNLMLNTLVDENIVRQELIVAN